MTNKTNKKEKKDKKVGLTILATAGLVGSAGLGVLCYLLAKDNKNLRIDKELYKDAYEGVAEKLIQEGETAKLVKKVVGGPLIDRLIKNEELKLSRVDNKITKLLERNIDDVSKKLLEIKQEDKKQILETIADFKNVKDVLK